MRAAKATRPSTHSLVLRTYNRQCSEIFQHRPNMLPVGLWRVTNKASHHFLERVDLEKEENPQEMPDVRGRQSAETLVIQSVQNAASNEWGDAKIALERAHMMGYSGVDLPVEDFSSEPEDKTLGMGRRHGQSIASCCEKT